MRLHASSHAVAMLAWFVCTALPAQDIKRYRTASAIVQFTLSGMQSGTETLWFDRHGMREAKLTQSVLTVAGHTVKTNRLTIFDNGTTITADLDRRTATKMPTPMFTDAVEAAKRQGGDMTDLGTAMIQRMGAVRTGTGTVAGKTCDVWEIKSLGSKSWLWNGITLRNDTNFAGQTMKTIATSVQENVTIPEDKFALPAGITATEGANPLDALRRAKEKRKGL